MADPFRKYGPRGFQFTAEELSTQDAQQLLCEVLEASEQIREVLFDVLDEPLQEQEADEQRRQLVAVNTPFCRWHLAADGVNKFTPRFDASLYQVVVGASEHAVESVDSLTKESALAHLDKESAGAALTQTRIKYALSLMIELEHGQIQPDEEHVLPKD